MSQTIMYSMDDCKMCDVVHLSLNVVYTGCHVYMYASVNVSKQQQQWQLADRSLCFCGNKECILSVTGSISCALIKIQIMAK